MQQQEIHSTQGNSSGSESSVSLQAVTRQVHHELRELLELRADVTRRIGALKKTVDGLTSLFGESALSEELRNAVINGRSDRRQGFTKMCREILANAEFPMTAREVCDRLLRTTPSLLERHKDPLASVNTVLNRLVQYGEAQSVYLPDNKRAWRRVAGANRSTDEVTNPPTS